MNGPVGLWHATCWFKTPVHVSHSTLSDDQWRVIMKRRYFLGHLLWQWIINNPFVSCLAISLIRILPQHQQRIFFWSFLPDLPWYLSGNIQTRPSGRWNFQSRQLAWLRESRFFGIWHQMGYALICMAFGRPSLWPIFQGCSILIAIARVLSWSFSRFSSDKQWVLFVSHSTSLRSPSPLSFSPPLSVQM